ncbi:MAG: DUF6463 family protein [Gemmatimonadota bacterium]
MGKLAARLLIGIGVLHLLLFLWFGRRVLVAIANEGFWNTVDPIRDRQMIFWALMTGIFGLLLGQLALWVEAHGKRLPVFLGWEIIAIALVGGVLMPESGGWLFLIPGVLVVIAARQA